MSKVRGTPRISVNKLGEYMVARPSRRLTIITEQKYPRDFIVARYTAAYDAIAECLVKHKGSRVIASAIQNLYDATPHSMWQQQDIELSIEALDLFLDLIDDIDLLDLTCVRAPSAGPDFKVGSVEVSVRPELYLQDGDAVKGAVKLSITKRNARPGDDQKEASAYVGTLLHQYTNEILAPKEKILASQCVVIDVFGQKAYSAPKSFARRRKDLAAACREIERGWPGA